MGQGPAASIGLRCRVHSASSFYSWLQTTKLSLIYFPRHYTDTVQIPLFLPQAIPSWESLGNNQQVRGQRSYLTPTQCSKVHAFMIPVILPSGSGPGVCNKAIILRKTWQIIINTVSWYMLFFQVLFIWNFSRLWKHIIRNSLYRVQCFRREIILLDLKFICKIYPTEKNEQIALRYVQDDQTCRRKNGSRYFRKKDN